VLGGVTNQILNIFLVLRDNDSQRLHLKDAGIRAVQGASQVVKEELAFEDAPQVIAKALALLLVHRFPSQ
jgi:RNA:NAD 2'-phosphotransferase (TPT1/KptA family)